MCVKSWEMMSDEWVEKARDQRSEGAEGMGQRGQKTEGEKLRR
jgi:hypothetical protein